MDRNIIVSATIAAAIHAGLLFGIRPGRAETPPPPVKMKPADDGRIRLDDPPPPPETNGGEEAPRPVAQSRTIIDEPLPTDRDSDFVIKVPRAPVSGPVIDQRIIPPLTPGSFGPSGVGAGGGGDGVFRIADLDGTPRARVTVAPDYPFDARHNGLGGEVLIEFTVDESGAVSTPQVVRSTNRIFEDAALRAVARWKFEPGKRGGRPVRFRMAVPIVFSLSGD